MSYFNTKLKHLI